MPPSLFGKFFAILPETIPSLSALSGTPSNKNKTRSKRGDIVVQGPLSRYESWYIGGTSYESISKQIDESLLSSSESITLHINSPGGEIDGCYELCEKIRSAKSIKPIYAKISGYGCSAAYWIASSCTEISATPTSLVGSIGVVAVVPSRGDDSFVFVSSQSPRKSQDPETENGAAEIQCQIDVLCDVFLADVARNRGVNVDFVKENFGKGAVFVGAKALDAQLVDKLENMEVSLQEYEHRERERILGLLDLNPKLDDLRNFISKGIEAPEAALELRKRERSKDDEILNGISPLVTLEKSESEQLIALARKFGVVS